MFSVDSNLEKEKDCVESNGQAKDHMRIENKKYVEKNASKIRKLNYKENEILETNDSNVYVEVTIDNETNTNENQTSLEAEYANDGEDEVFNRLTDKEQEDLRMSLFEQYLEKEI